MFERFVEIVLVTSLTLKEAQAMCCLNCVCATGYYPPVIQSAPATPPVVSASWLNDALQRGTTRVLDAAYTQSPRADPTVFRATRYGRFRELIANQTNPEYASSHIPGAVHFDLDIAQFPGETERYSLYPPDLFEQYVRLLGVNEGDHITVAGRGRAAGMLFAARVWWLFRVYGHDRVSVLDGGLDAWTASGYSVNNQTAGNWKAKSIDRNRVITFEEIDWKNLDKINFLDARPRALFNGTEPLGVESSKPLTGAHVKGAKNVPAVALVENGRFFTPARINQELTAVGFDPSKPTVVMCNTGIQASMLTLALAHAGYDRNIKLYNGSLFQLALIAPDLISEK